MDGISDFNALHSGKHGEEVQLCAFDVLAMDGDDLRRLPLSMRKTNLERLLHAGLRGFFSARLSKERSARTCFARPASSGLRVLSRSIATGLIKPAGQSTGSRSRTGSMTLSLGCRKPIDPVTPKPLRFWIHRLPTDPAQSDYFLCAGKKAQREHESPPSWSPSLGTLLRWGK